jgi:WD40 repeat protein
MQGHTSDIEAVAFSPNAKFIVSASEDQFECRLQIRLFERSFMLNSSPAPCQKSA